MATRRAILDLLKRQGPADAASLAAGLGITHPAVRRHLDGLVADGLVETALQRRPVGRPATVYRLTDVGDETFPRGYAELADSLLDAVADELGPGGVERVFARRGARLTEQVAGAGGDVAAATAALAEAQDAAGYLATATPLDDDTALLVEHNCAIARIARRWPQACAAELAAFREALGDAATVERVHHMANGDRTCTYLVRAKGRA